MEQKKEGKIAVFDLGGGTYDISILDIGEGLYETLSINGDTHLGGDDFDEVLIKYVAEEFRKKEGINLLDDVTKHSVRIWVWTPTLLHSHDDFLAINSYEE